MKASKKQWAVKEMDTQVHSITTCKKEISTIRCASVISLTLLQFSDKTMILMYYINLFIIYLTL